jgi:uncharacterized protein (DUF2141 family)
VSRIRIETIGRPADLSSRSDFHCSPRDDGVNIRSMRRVIGVASLLVVACLALATGRARSQDANTLVFVVRGIRSDVGTIAGGIYSDPSVWTHDGGQVATCRVPIHHGTARCVIQAPGPGTYAFAFLHDEDGDGRMRVDSIGLPQEGYGFGNDARPGLGAPSFESAAIVLTPGAHVERTVTVRYGISL